jgi:glycosyltransferase involved in cell wall biosynthesis
MNSANSKLPPGGPALIAPVPDGIVRPFWSIMIPSFNCSQYLRQTLQGVLDQDLGPEQMQIEVVDDCSTKDDPEAVVKELGRGRVSFFRQPLNVGATANFNTCISRSSGHWIHILHGDDFVLPGFYENIRRVIDLHSNVATVFTRSYIVDAQGEIEYISPRIPGLESGGREFPQLQNGNPIQTPSVVVKRDFYVNQGGFDSRFCHVADWEMWFRATTLAGAVAINQVLASYRQFATNDTGRLARTAENLRDFERFATIAAERNPDAADWPRFRQLIMSLALTQMDRFAREKIEDATTANWKFWRERSTWREYLSQCLKGFNNRK